MNNAMTLLPQGFLYLFQFDLDYYPSLAGSLITLAITIHALDGILDCLRSFMSCLSMSSPACLRDTRAQDAQIQPYCTSVA